MAYSFEDLEEQMAEVLGHPPAVDQYIEASIILFDRGFINDGESETTLHP